MTVQPKTSIHEHLPDNSLDTLDIAALEFAKSANQPGLVDTTKLIENHASGLRSPSNILSKAFLTPAKLLRQMRNTISSLTSK